MTLPSTPVGSDGTGAMFDGIAQRYDLLNRLISLGVDQRWRKATVGALKLKPQSRVLDLATGTGDLALLIARLDPTAQVVGLDPSFGMLSVAKEKIRRAGLESRIELVLGEAQNLPFEAQSFDGVTMAFGIRNVPDREQALREMRRVIRPEGHVSILELSEPSGGLIAPLARFHIHTLVPFVGGLLSSSREYRYLERSIAAFPPASRFSEMLNEAGFTPLEARSLTFGVCHLYVATPRLSLINA